MKTRHILIALVVGILGASVSALSDIISVTGGQVKGAVTNGVMVRSFCKPIWYVMFSFIASLYLEDPQAFLQNFPTSCTIYLFHDLHSDFP